MTDDPRNTQSQKSQNQGSNQIAVRSYNERLILQQIRKHGNLTKAEATRATGLSANAVSTIFRALEAADLIIKEAPLRGRVGQPSTPERLNPDAHYYIGLKIGRKSTDLVLINFVGDVLASESLSHAYPMPQDSVDFVRTGIPKILKTARCARKRVSGFGVAMPSEIWSWRDEMGAPDDVMEAWRHFDLAGELGQAVPWPISVFNDGTAACGAELVFKEKGDKQDFIYLFIGTMIGGGVVLNGSVFFGRTGNAGGFGPMRVPGGEFGGNRLIDHASLFVLERMLEKSGLMQPDLGTESDLWTTQADIVERWLDTASYGISHAIASSMSVIDFEAVIVDGSLPDFIRARLVVKIKQAFQELDLQGLTSPSISGGHCGAIARAVGAAALLLNQRYLINQNTLLRS